MIDYKKQVTDPRWVQRSREIMRKDNFTCQLCGRKNTRLNVHHIRYISGKDYWDYPDNLLMTVCEVCHSKIHGKYVEKIHNTHKGKIMFLEVLRNKDLTPNAKIILSDIISTKKCLSIRKHAKRLNISEKSFDLCLKSLISKGYLDKDKNVLYEISRIIYFPLLIESGLKGELLIFYSYLKNKSSYFGGSIDTFKYKLAEEFCTTKIAVTNLLNKLYRKGYAKRLDNGKLKIN